MTSIIMPLMTHTRATMAGATSREFATQANLKPVSVRLQAATRLHEVGIASNRGPARHGEYVPALYTPAWSTTSEKAFCM